MHNRDKTHGRLGTFTWRPSLLLAVSASVLMLGPAHAAAGAEREESMISTAQLTGISSPLAFILSEHFPDLSVYPEFDIAMNGPDRCAQISPIACD
jgi:hypothetical protein